MRNDSKILVFGEVLFDTFPDGHRVLGGAPFNVAWHLQAFGLSPLFISRIGNDPPGHEISTLMESWGMNLDALQTDLDHPTGSVRVSIKNGEPEYEIVAQCAYDFISVESMHKKKTEGILYHGSLAIRNPAARSALQAIKSRHKGKIFIDVNLRPPWWRLDSLSELLHDAAWIKLNEAELSALCPRYKGLENAMQAFCTRFDLEGLIVTRGANGAIAWDRRQNMVAATPPPKILDVADTVGAGDAFSAVMLLGLSRKWPLQIALERAQTFAGAIVSQRGATVSDRSFYRSFIEQWR